MSSIGIVIEGFNEGERLRRCLASLLSSEGPMVYVDSGSTDGSLELAQAAGCAIVKLDVSRVPFNCARARNAGFVRLMDADPAIEFVQFVDADCEIAAGWRQRAAEALRADPGLAVICGRLREKNREASIYSRLCDMEWDGPPGEVETCGGISMVRAGAFAEAGCFDVNLGAGEEIELCTRLRARGYKVVRTRDEMGLHDANMTQFRQWWNRAAKYGYAYVKAVATGRGDSHKLRHTTRAILWGGAMPVAAAAGVVIGMWERSALLVPVSVALLHVLLSIRVFRARRRRCDTVADAWLYSLFCVASKWPHFAGVLRFAFRG